MGHGIMNGRADDHATVIDWYVSGKEEDLSRQTDDYGKDEQSMYHDSYTQPKERRRKNIQRKQSDRFDDYVKEKRVRKPRNNKVKYYDYEQWE